MCFGMTTTGQSTTSSTPNPAVSSAATSNLDYIQNLANTGFTPYTGQQVATLSPDQQASFAMTNNIANNGTAPAAQSLIDTYSNAPAQSVSADKIYNNMSPYMNQYVMQALAPQLQQMDIDNAKTNANTNALATGSGAFGDARTGIEQANNNFLQGVQREGVIGQAYNNAFNTAISAGAQDVSNDLSAQNANANYAEQALSRALQGSSALQGLQTQQLGVANQVNQMGQQQTAQDQANLTAQYNQWLLAQQYPFQVAQLMNQGESAAAQAMPATTTTTQQAPNNAGLSILGSVVGSFLSDRDVKEEIERIGKMEDGTPLYSYRYFFDPKGTVRFGPMAQDIEKRNPEAVTELWPGGAKVVNADLATRLSRALAMKEAA